MDDKRLPKFFLSKSKKEKYLKNMVGKCTFRALKEVQIWSKNCLFSPRRGREDLRKEMVMSVAIKSILKYF